MLGFQMSSDFRCLYSDPRVIFKSTSLVKGSCTSTVWKALAAKHCIVQNISFDHRSNH